MDKLKNMYEDFSKESFHEMKIIPKINYLDKTEKELELIETQHEDIQNDIGVAESVTHTFESLIEYITPTIESKRGLSKFEAEQIDKIVSSKMKLINIEKTVFAIESFGVETSRLEATKLSLEDIKENLSKGKEVLSDLLKKLKEFMKKYWLKFFDGVNKAQTYSNKLKPKIEKFTGNPTKVDLGKNAVHLAIQGKLSSKSEIISALDDVLKATMLVYDNNNIMNSELPSFDMLIGGMSSDGSSISNESEELEKTEIDSLTKDEMVKIITSIDKILEKIISHRDSAEKQTDNLDKIKDESNESDSKEADALAVKKKTNFQKRFSSGIIKVVKSYFYYIELSLGGKDESAE